MCVSSDDFEQRRRQYSGGDGEVEMRRTDDCRVCSVCHSEYINMATFMEHKAFCNSADSDLAATKKMRSEDTTVDDIHHQRQRRPLAAWNKRRWEDGVASPANSYCREEDAGQDADEENGAISRRVREDTSDADGNGTDDAGRSRHQARGEDDAMDSEVAEGLDDDYDMRFGGQPPSSSELLVKGGEFLGDLPPNLLHPSFSRPSGDANDHLQKMLAQYAQHPMMQQQQQLQQQSLHPYAKLSTLHSSNESLKAVMAQTTALLNDKSAGADLSPADLAFLQTMLYSLQQQQLVQLQLIQHIQHQLIASQPPAPSGSGSTAPTPATDPSMASMTSPLSGCLPPLTSSLTSFPWMKSLADGRSPGDVRPASHDDGDFSGEYCE